MRNNIGETFSAKRMGVLMKKYVVENRMSLLISAGCVTLVMVIIGIINGWSYGYSYLDGSLVEIGFMTNAFFLCGMIVAASPAFDTMWNQKNAIVTLMTPASQLEKFIVRWIVSVPCYVVWGLFSAFFADVLKKFFVVYVMGGEIDMLKWNSILFGGEGVDMDSNPTVFYSTLLLFIFIQSFYLLGSIVWRKKNFIKTTYVLVVLFVVYGVAWNIMINTPSPEHFIRKTFTLEFMPMQLFMVLGIIVNYVLTYKRFREADIIHRW
ncbi:MAG: hypothetical protein NC349_03660 [Paenibacillus sp.]|nr:hypothetical protein [Paenibacillus sp.]